MVWENISQTESSRAEGSTTMLCSLVQWALRRLTVPQDEKFPLGRLGLFHVHTGGWGGRSLHAILSSTGSQCSDFRIFFNRNIDKCFFPLRFFHSYWCDFEMSAGLRALWKWGGCRYRPVGEEDSHHHLAARSPLGVSGKIGAPQRNKSEMYDYFHSAIQPFTLQMPFHRNSTQRSFITSSRQLRVTPKSARGLRRTSRFTSSASLVSRATR